MLVYIIGKPRNQEELEAIWGHESIIFVDTIEEYEQHRLTGKKPDLVFIDDVEPTKPTTGVDNELRDHPRCPVHHRAQ